MAATSSFAPIMKLAQITARITRSQRGLQMSRTNSRRPIAASDKSPMNSLLPLFTQRQINGVMVRTARERKAIIDCMGMDSSLRKKRMLIVTVG
ncbi:MAG: hypothetical protein OEV64_09975 [Desulfobulbaceae bacterium]|nr:hypothetical protein [Desulfobulbaceae bacterium]